MPEPLEIEFFGAAGEVTGSCHLLHIGRRTVLLECGLVQGGRDAGRRNREPFPFDPRRIDAVVLSHAHIDHSGRLPLLVQRGYPGPIFAQRTTRDLVAIMLEDSARLAEHDADTENRRRERKGMPRIEPLYTVADVERTMRQFRPLPYEQREQIVPGVSIRYQDAGHILGSGSVELWIDDDGRERKLVFSGDLGQYGTPILRDPAVLTEADVVLMESTYGNRLHRDKQATLDEIAGIIASADHRRGKILIPAFAIGRTQELLYLFATHYREWGLERWQIFLDSPMAIRASQVYWDNPQLYDAEATKLRRELGGMPLLPKLVLAESAEDSQRINRIRSGAIVIAGSGMCEGGRIQHHLKHNVWRPECHVVIVGYQAHGTLGRQLVDGQPMVRIHHEAIRVRAEVHTVGGLSAHGDRDDLARWYGSFRTRPPVYIVHGEPDAAAGLREKLVGVGATAVRAAVPGLRVDLRDPAAAAAA